MNEYQSTGDESPSLIGELYEDYTNLVNLYNQRNLKALTCVEDINKNILLYLNIKDINNFCKSNKDARNICNESFWKLKYRQNDIPMDDFPDNLKDWIENYKLWDDAYHKATLILYIVNIERTRIDDRTDGYFHFESITDNKLLLKITSMVNIKAVVPLYPAKAVEFTINWEVPSAHDRMCKAITYALRYPDQIFVTDRNRISFLPDTNYIDQLSNQKFRTYQIILYKRIGIMDSFNYNLTKK